MWRALLSLSVAEWRHHPWRHGVALLAVALGVALASSVQMINASALAEFSQALRTVNGQPDAVLAASGREGFDDALYARLVLDASVALVSPVLEIDSQGRRDAGAPRSALRIVGVDALKVAAIAPGLLPRPGPVVEAAGAGTAVGAGTGTGTGTGASAGAGAGTGAGQDTRPDRGRLPFLDPDAAFLNPAALAALAVKPGDPLQLQSATGWQSLRVAGSVAVGGAPLVVIDIAAAQARFDRAGRLSRLDLRLLPGLDAAAWQRELVGQQALPAGVRWASADDAVQRVSNLSRAYRVNLGVLAMVALLVGGFLVYSVVSLSVAQRTPSLALLGVLGLAAGDRRRLVLMESAVVGALGSVIGLAAGAGLAALALRLLGGDLGGGYFAGGAPALAWPPVALAACAVLGMAASVVGAWWLARQAEKLSPALALKGLGGQPTGRVPVWPGLALLAGGGVLALLPPVAGLPLAAYAAVAALLAGGVVLVPALVQALIPALEQALAWAPGAGPRQPIALLALRRARFARQTASATVSGVVASLALSVAITVMVGSFRGAVVDWLDTALPADLYARSNPSSGAADQVFLPPGFAARVAGLPGVARVVASRQVALQLRPQQPTVALLARPLGPDAAATLPMLGAVRPASVPAPGQAAELGVYVSEPAAAIYGWQVGDLITLPLAVVSAGAQDTRAANRVDTRPDSRADPLTDPLTDTRTAAPSDATASAAQPASTVGHVSGVSARVRGVWRDYARQFGAIAIDAADYRLITGDARVNDIALWLAPGAAPAEVEAAVQAAAGPDLPLEIASTASLRTLSLRIFDRSFAVTFYLQAVAIAVGLVGVAASLSAQVLARRKEFGLLAHLGLTRRQVIALVGAEATAWLLAGCLIGLALGLLMAVVLVKVVNPQSFHWTMPLLLPGPRLAALAGAVLAAGSLTALWSARRAAGRSAVLAVKEDW